MEVQGGVCHFEFVVKTRRQFVLNTALITGVLRRPSADRFFIQQTNNVHLWLPIKLPAEIALPGRGEEFQHVTAECMLFGAREEDLGERVVQLEAKSVRLADPIDMPMQKAWHTVVPDFVPVDAYCPEVFGDENEERSNRVEFAGFVVAKYLMPPKDSDRPDANRTLATLIQIDQNPDHAVPVRFYGARTPIFNEHMKIGSPVVVEGQFRIKVVPCMENGLNKDGFYPVILLPYIHASGPSVAGFTDIEEIPDWIESEHLKQRNRAIAYPARPAAQPAINAI